MTRSINQKCLSPLGQCTSAHHHCDKRNIGGNALAGIATPYLWSWRGTKWFPPGQSTQRCSRRKRI